MLAATADKPLTPPPSEVYPYRLFPQRHPHLLSEGRVRWALRHRRTNGLAAAGAVFESPSGALLIHEPAFIVWFLGLSGRAKPRALRKGRAARA